MKLFESATSKPLVLIDWLKLKAQLENRTSPIILIYGIFGIQVSIGNGDITGNRHSESWITVRGQTLDVKATTQQQQPSLR